MYWYTIHIFNTPDFSKIITRTRFQVMLEIFYFNDNEGPSYDPSSDERDILHKFCPFIELMADRCKEVFYSGRNSSVDELLVFSNGLL